MVHIFNTSLKLGCISFQLGWSPLFFRQLCPGHRKEGGGVCPSWAVSNNLRVWNGCLETEVEGNLETLFFRDFSPNFLCCEFLSSTKSFVWTCKSYFQHYRPRALTTLPHLNFHLSSPLPPHPWSPLLWFLPEKLDWEAWPLMNSIFRLRKVRGTSILCRKLTQPSNFNFFPWSTI